MLTGRHWVRDVYCKKCEEKLGWMYEFAMEEQQRYKESRVILERALVKERDGFEETPPANWPPWLERETLAKILPFHFGSIGLTFFDSYVVCFPENPYLTLIPPSNLVKAFESHRCLHCWFNLVIFHILVIYKPWFSLLEQGLPRSNFLQTFKVCSSSLRLIIIFRKITKVWFALTISVSPLSALKPLVTNTDLCSWSISCRYYDLCAFV